MKNFPRFLVPLAALALLVSAGSLRAEDTAAPADTTTAPAAKGKKGGPRAQAASNRFTDLNLTADQQAKVEQIAKKEAADLKAVRTDTALAAKEKRSKEAAIRDTANSQIRALLTPEQASKFEQDLAANATKAPKKAGKKAKN
jgi:periplasmic protein CpxP/Spy